jgi:hypothetical protein
MLLTYPLPLDNLSKCLFKENNLHTFYEVFYMNGPEKRFIAGNISATIWANNKVIDGKTIPVMTVSVQKSYKDKTGAWKQTGTLLAADLPKAKLVIEKAYEHLAMTQVATE